jgi:hypothetical protein
MTALLVFDALRTGRNPSFALHLLVRLQDVEIGSTQAADTL